MEIANKHIVLETRNLTIGYRNKKNTITVANNIDLCIKKGNLIGVIGKNGIGKSTLLRTISGVQEKLNGAIFINKKSIETFSNKALSTSLSLVLTDAIPESQLTVFEIIALGRQPYTNWLDSLTKEDLEKVNKAILQTDLETLQNKQFHTLSDGQKQRVLIARALAQDTDLIIMDEPTAHLDIYHTIKIFKLLKKIVKETNKTIIISSHQINLCIQLTNAIILLSEKQVEFDTVKGLIEKKSFTKLFPEEIVKFNEELEQFIITKK